MHFGLLRCEVCLCIDDTSLDACLLSGRIYECCCIYHKRAPRARWRVGGGGGVGGRSKVTEAQHHIL